MDRFINQIVCGDAKDVLSQIPDCSVHCCITSPPYYRLRRYSGEQSRIWNGDSSCKHQWVSYIQKGITGGKKSSKVQIKGKENFQIVLDNKYKYCSRCDAWYGELGQEPTPELYVQHLVEIFREVKRVLRKDGTLWLIIGDTYAGTQFRPNIKPRDLIGIPWMVAFALRNDGWHLRQDIIWSKTNPMPESIANRCTRSHEYIFLLTKCLRYYYDNEAIKEPSKYIWNSAQSSFAKPGEKEQNIIVQQNMRIHGGDTHHPDREQNTRNKRSVWNISTQPRKEFHFATFPDKLVHTCILAGTSEKGCCTQCGSPYKRIVDKNRVSTRPAYNSKTYNCHPQKFGNRDPKRHITLTTTAGWKKSCKCNSNDISQCVVLDPFGGAGITASIAQILGRNFIHIDISQEYCDVAQKRINNSSALRI